jgi:uncharacterized protein
MSTLEAPRAGNVAYETNGHYDGMTRVFLQPIAAPSILGLFGFAGATFIVAAQMAGWYGGPSSGLYLAPFAATFGGLAQFLAGMWAYRARDAVATAMHGMWGAFWIAYGILNLLFATKVLVEPKPVFSELGFWFIALGAITLMGTLGALVEGSLGVTAVLGTLAAGSIVAAVHYLTGDPGWATAAGYVFVVSAILAWYVASAMMLASAAGRVVLPLGKLERDKNVPGRKPDLDVEFPFHEPGVIHGQ